MPAQKGFIINGQWVPASQVQQTEAGMMQLMNPTSAEGGWVNIDPASVTAQAVDDPGYRPTWTGQGTLADLVNSELGGDYSRFGDVLGASFTGQSGIDAKDAFNRASGQFGAQQAATNFDNYFRNVTNPYDNGNAAWWAAPAWQRVAGLSVDPAQEAVAQKNRANIGMANSRVGDQDSMLLGGDNIGATLGDIGLIAGAFTGAGALGGSGFMNSLQSLFTNPAASTGMASTAAPAATSGAMDWTALFDQEYASLLPEDYYSQFANGASGAENSFLQEAMGGWNPTEASMNPYGAGGMQPGGLNSVGVDWSNPSNLFQAIKSVPGVGNLLGGSGSVAQRGLSALFGGNGANGDYRFPAGDVLGSLLSYAGNRSNMQQYTDAMRYAVDKADPFASQRPFYQGQLQSMFTDPNYFANSNVMRGLNDVASNAANRSMAAKGYNNSGNQEQEIANQVQKQSYQYANNLMQQVGGFAGAGFGPGQAGQLAGQGAQNQLAGNNAGNAALGYGMQSVMNGNQPSTLEQMFGKPKNNTLTEQLGFA